jgi:hypothetical protein
MRFSLSMMASGKSSKQNRRPVPVVSSREGLPWLAITAVAVVVALITTIFIVVYGAKRDKDAALAAEAAIAEQLRPWEPTTENPDPSTKIPGIYVGAADAYKAALHVEAPQRVAYDRFPPVGGPHDGVWAACNGVVYTKAVRSEHMVHALEHGAIWITYNPDSASAADVETLRALVEAKPYMLMSPYPALQSKISLQAWGHQLMVDSPADERIRQFITALRENPTNTPELNGSCSQPTFDTESPPAFEAGTPGSDAIPLDGGTLQSDTAEMVATTADTATETSDTAGATTSTPAPTS